MDSNIGYWFFLIAWISISIVGVIWVIVLIIKSIYDELKDVKLDMEHINEESYLRYAKFYGNTIPTDLEFNTKVNKIYELITKDKESDIKKIAKSSNCTLEECVLKIRYLKNKKLLEYYYIDTNNFMLLKCSSEDQKLIEKYKPYIYGSHLQINEIANMVSNKGYKDIHELRDEVYNDLVYLDKKGLLNGIKIDDIDRKIIYYTIEKRKFSDSYESVHCPNCGAINDVEVSSKVRCGYCKTIIKGSKYEENI